MLNVKNYLPNILSIGAGLLVGGIAGYSLAKFKYTRHMDQEIEEIKVALSKYYINQFANSNEVVDEEDIQEDVVSLEEPEEEHEEKEYTDYTAYFKSDENEPIKVVAIDGTKVLNAGDRPYVIHPNEFGMDDNYGIITIDFFKDHILADEDGDVIENVDETIGVESLNHFGEYEDIENAVYVCNDKTMCYYEIIKHDETYEEFCEKNSRKGVL